MSWTQVLCQTYDLLCDAKDDNGLPKIPPVYHDYHNAQIEVTVDIDGNFKAASLLDKKGVLTLIPVTEKSLARTSGSDPHALADELQYIAGDLSKVSGQEKLRNHFNSYISALKDWAESDCSHPKVRVIYNYLQKETLISDLIKSGILTDEDIKKGKLGTVEIRKLFVRFRVIGGEDDEKSATWEDLSLSEQYIKYRQSKTKDRILCYISGVDEVLMNKHPSNIIGTAKLISSDDNDPKSNDFTFLGRFVTTEQACSIGTETSLELHSALRWLLRNNRFTVGANKHQRTFICWSPSFKQETSDIFKDILAGFDFDDKIEKYRRYFSENDSQIQRLKKTLNGIAGMYTESDNVVVMSLEAASPGRLSITYYNEQPARTFFGRVQNWAETFHWFYRRKSKDSDKYDYQDFSPSIGKIVQCAYGVEHKSQNSKDYAKLEVDDKIMPEQYQRLVKCMLDKLPFPKDMLQLLVRKASNLQNYSEFANREDVLSTACAAINKYKFDRKLIQEDSFTMKLDPNNSNRSYLFGRLLAVLEKIERVTYDDGENREPNAIRLQSVFVNRPMQTWKTLDSLLIPYYQKLFPGARENYRKKISEIAAMFREEDASSMNKSLDDNYLLGYYLQRMELRNKDVKGE